MYRVQLYTADQESYFEKPVHMDLTISMTYYLCGIKDIMP